MTVMIDEASMIPLFLPAMLLLTTVVDRVDNVGPWKFGHQ